MAPDNSAKLRRRTKLWLCLGSVLLLMAVALRLFSPALNANYNYSSRYLTMRDGTRIAVDLYLPKDLKPGERIPAIMLQTRYYRGHRLRKPFGLFWSDIHERTIRFFVSHQYAYVTVDVRGAGASFGTRKQEWSPDEIKDGAQVVDWIIQQPWSNQKVGATGGSYDGTASEFLASNRHPAVKAVMPFFSIFDAYSDMAYPGGVETDHLEMWSNATQALDRNKFGEKFLTGFPRFAYKGVRPVNEDTDENLLQAALREHSTNYDLLAMLQGLSFHDDGGYVEAMSPYARRKDTEASGTAVYSFEGWYDGAMPHAAVKRFLNIKGSRLVLGPWDHQTRDASPFPAENGREFFRREALRFFDFYLKGIDNGLAAEKPVRYYTVAENKWKSSDVWPPAANNTVYYLGDGRSLSTEKPGVANAGDIYQVDFTASTGNSTRWDSMFILDDAPGLYGLRDNMDKKLLLYSSPPLGADMEVTGHPTVTLFAEANGQDGNFFVYLEDVDEQQHAHYVTEGLLRALHRKISSAAPPYKDVVPYHSYTHQDAQPLVPGQVAELTFDLQPISYLFRKGHSIRIALAGADRDHFSPPPGAATTVRFYRDAEHPSSITLPVVARP